MCRFKHAMKQLNGEALTLIMTHNTNQNVVFMTKIAVIPHFSSQKNICSNFNSLVQQKFTGSSTQGHSLQNASRALGVLYRLNAKLLSYPSYEFSCMHRLRKCTNDTTTTIHFRVWQQEMHIVQAQALSYHKVHTPRCIIQVCVSCINGYLLLNGQCYTTFHLCSSDNPPKRTKQKGMMRHNHITAHSLSFSYHFFSDVKTQ